MLIARFALFILVLTALNGFSQDSLKLTIEEAEALFTKKNLVALAASYNVEAQRAFEIQARLYPNPFVSTELNVSSSDHPHDPFNIGNQGQKAFSIDQLILLGGKRKNEIILSKYNTTQAEYEFNDLLRNLKLQLRTGLYEAFFDQLTVQKLDEQLNLLDAIIDAYEVQANKGNIPYKEVIRLKSVYIKLSNDREEYIRNVLSAQKSLQILLQTSAFVYPQLDLSRWPNFEREYNLDSLVATALENRPDSKLAELNIQQAQAYFNLQKSLAVPNLNLGGNYDQRGNAFRNQFSVTLGIPLPVFNRNQGNIKYADTQTQIAGINFQHAKNQVAVDVQNAWLRLRSSVSEFRKIRSIYNAEFQTVFNGISENFQKRNVTLLEFVDFFESYSDTLIEYNRLQKQVAVSAENLSYSTGTNLF